MEVLADRDPLESMLLDTAEIHARDGNSFLNAEVVALEPDERRVHIVPSDRAGSAVETVSYDYLVVALGARLAYDEIEGFGEHGDTVSSAFYGNKLRGHLASYGGGPIAIGSARFHQGLEGKPDWLPVGLAACEGPPLELGLAMRTGSKSTTRATPAASRFSPQPPRSLRVRRLASPGGGPGPRREQADAQPPCRNWRTSVRMFDWLGSSTSSPP
jgi:sulfide:quinone oxidoreductase